MRSEGRSCEVRQLPQLQSKRDLRNGQPCTILLLQSQMGLTAQLCRLSCWATYCPERAKLQTILLAIRGQAISDARGQTGALASHEIRHALAK